MFASTPPTRSRWRRACLLSVALLGCMAARAVQAQEVTSPGANPERPWNVVILNEADQSLPAFIALDSAMRTALTAPRRHPVDTFSESLDLLRFPKAGIEDEIVALLAKKILLNAHRRGCRPRPGLARHR